MLAQKISRFTQSIIYKHNSCKQPFPALTFLKRPIKPRKRSPKIKAVPTYCIGAAITAQRFSPPKYLESDSRETITARGSSQRHSSSQIVKRGSANFIITHTRGTKTHRRT